MARNDNKRPVLNKRPPPPKKNTKMLGMKLEQRSFFVLLMENKLADDGWLKMVEI